MNVKNFVETVIQVALAIVMVLLAIAQAISGFHNLGAIAIEVAIWLGLAYFVSYVFKDRSLPRRRIKM